MATTNFNFGARFRVASPVGSAFVEALSGEAEAPAGIAPATETFDVPSLVPGFPPD